MLNSEIGKPRKAFLLAAGYGMRMRPLTNTVPKALMPLWGRPVIDSVIDRLAGWGVEDVLVNLHHEAGAIVEHLSGRTGGPRVHFSFEPEILGTGGGLVRARWFFGDEPFWMMNTDIAAELSPRRLLQEFRARQPLAALWMEPDKGPRTVHVSGGAIANFRSATPGSAGTFTFCGLQLVSPALFEFLKDEQFHSVIEVYEAAMRAGHEIRGVVVPGSFWADLGSPADYLTAHRDVWHAYVHGGPGAGLVRPELMQRMARAAMAGIRIQGFAAIGEGATLQSGARIQDSVIWPGARIGRHAELESSIVGSGTRVDFAFTGPVVRALDYNRTAVFRGILDRLGFRVDDTAVCPLPPRGSNRSFARLACGRRTAMLIHYNLARPENARFAGHARYLLKHGVPVPRILVDMPREQTVVVEDIGEQSLETEAGRMSQRQLELHYRRVLDALLALHGIPVQSPKSGHPELEPAFSATVYQWERDLMAKYFLRGRLHLPSRTVRAVLSELLGMERILLRQPDVLVHRDMQSSNVLLRQGKPVFIDFQGMRLGPAAYDLASLLCDPYVMLPAALQDRLLRYYLDRCGEPENVAASYWPAAVQRLSQALGAYGRLSAIPGTGRFAAYIPPALDMLSRALAHVEGLDALRKVVTLIR